MFCLNNRQSCSDGKRTRRTDSSVCDKENSTNPNACTAFETFSVTGLTFKLFKAESNERE